MEAPWSVHAGCMEMYSLNNAQYVELPYNTRWRLHGASIHSPWHFVAPLYAISMTSPWRLHGASMAPLWRLCGIVIDAPWRLHGTSMDAPLRLHSRSMALPWRVYGASMAPLCNFHGVFIVLVWTLHGTSRNPSRRLCGASMIHDLPGHLVFFIYRGCFCGGALNLAWALHDSGFHGASMALPWRCH